MERGRICAPQCKVPGCEQKLKFWCHYLRRAVRGYDGVRLAPIPICRFRCPTRGHGTTSYLPPFLHRYLHYASPVVEVVVEALSIGPNELLHLADGPSAETLARWSSELTSIPVRNRLLRRLPESWQRAGHLFVAQTEQACTWLVADALRRFFKLESTVTGLLQRMRLSLMTRYFTAH